MRAVCLSSSVLLLVVAAMGCSNRTGTPGRDGGGGGGGETGAQCTDGIDNDGDGLTDCDEGSCFTTPACGNDGGNRPDGGFSGCEALPFEAETRNAPVDVVWIIDNSGSMSEETALVQANMNDFAATISASGIDYHVIVITDPGAFGLSVPPPLGTDTTRFRLVNVSVGSHDIFEKLLESYSMWSDFLRPDAALHFINLTDDESDTNADAFFSSMITLTGGRGFSAHSICSLPADETCPFGPPPCAPFGMGCTGPHGDAPATGNQYVALAARTGGLLISICSADWSIVFDTLLMSIAVPMAIPCEFDIPEPPEGMMFDRMRVNVLYTPAGGVGRTIPNVGNAGACPAGGEGWFYDDAAAPRQIILCPSTCSTIEADATGRVDIELGCETIFG